MTDHTMNGEMNLSAERDLLRIGRELAMAHALVHASRMVAVGAMTSNGTDAVNPPWFEAETHLAPLSAASEELRVARLAIRRAVDQLQSTNPVPKRPCTNYQHEGYPRADDRPCTECSGTGWVAGPEQER